MNKCEQKSEICKMINNIKINEIKGSKQDKTSKQWEGEDVEQLSTFNMINFRRQSNI